jgi:hypothetical protein
MNGETGIQTGSIRELSFPLYNCKGWMKLVGVMSIIGGALYALTIIGIIVAWLPIWTGILLFQSANAVGQAYETDNKAALTVSLSKLKTYFIIMGILTLIGVIVGVLAFFFGFLGAGLAALSHK